MRSIRLCTFWAGVGLPLLHAAAAAPAVEARPGPGWLTGHLPAILFDLELMQVQAWQWIGFALAAALGLVVAIGLGALLEALALRVARRTRATWDDLLVRALSGPARLLLGLGASALVIRQLGLAASARDGTDVTLRVLVVVALTWAALRTVGFGADVMAERLSRSGQPDGPARVAMTRVMVLKRVLGVVIVLLGAALVLLQFSGMRTIGASLLASAGVAGVVIGFAAQRSLGMLLAGVQISFTQPIRVGDVVVIEGEWGNVEEITLTYVVVRTWDLRRLIVPMTKILESPFQNWSRGGEQILGTVFIYADYRVPIQAVRSAVERFVEGRADWDGRAVGLQVTDATDRTVELRALVSASDSAKAWDLRCALREHLVSFLQQLEGGAYLPRVRVGEERAQGDAVRAGDGRPEQEGRRLAASSDR